MPIFFVANESSEWVTCSDYGSAVRGPTAPENPPSFAIVFKPKEIRTYVGYSFDNAIPVGVKYAIANVAYLNAYQAEMFDPRYPPAPPRPKDPAEEPLIGLVSTLNKIFVEGGFEFFAKCRNCSLPRGDHEPTTLKCPFASTTFTL